MAALPEAISTIIVSPTARPRPERDAGGDARRGRRQHHARRWSASAPRPARSTPRRSCAARRAAPPRDSVKITGMTANDSATPDTSALRRESRPNTFWNQVAITISAKKPSTTEGMPASSSMTGLTISRVARAGVLRHEDGGADAQRDRDQHRDQRDLERADDERPDAVLRDLGDRLPDELGLVVARPQLREPHLAPASPRRGRPCCRAAARASLAMNTRMRTIATTAEIASACSSHSAARCQNGAFDSISRGGRVAAARSRARSIVASAVRSRARTATRRRSRLRARRSKSAREAVAAGVAPSGVVTGA